jgi:hypothetical protein
VADRGRRQRSGAERTKSSTWPASLPTVTLLTARRLDREHGRQSSPGAIAAKLQNGDSIPSPSDLSIFAFPPVSNGAPQGVHGFAPAATRSTQRPDEGTGGADEVATRPRRSGPAG